MIDASIFSKFPRWSGEIPPNYRTDFVGSLIANRYRKAWPEPGTPEIPVRDEEFFEWCALLDAVAAAKSSFTMIEAGAGYGRWTVRAACAARSLNPDVALRLICIEAEPTHFAWLHEHLDFNRVSATCIRAVINATGEPATFTVGHPDEWYGQAAVPVGAAFGNWPNATIETAPGITLNAILRDLDTVDLLDMDIQGAETECIPATIGAITSKVKRVFVGTHSTEATKAVGSALSGHHWRCVASYPHAQEVRTEIGVVKFRDGVEYWVNDTEPTMWRRLVNAVRRRTTP